MYRIALGTRCTRKGDGFFLRNLDVHELKRVGGGFPCGVTLELRLDKVGLPDAVCSLFRCDSGKFVLGLSVV